MLKTFRIGGVHPEANKLCRKGNTKHRNSCRSKYSVSTTYWCARQTHGKRGDKVKVGTLIGKSAGFVSANIHSSVSGTVKNRQSIRCKRLPSRCRDYRCQGDEWEDPIDRSETLIKECNLSQKKLSTRLLPQAL